MEQLIVIALLVPVLALTFMIGYCTAMEYGSEKWRIR